MKVVFLDIDGVLCTPRACFAVGDKGIFSYLDPIACLLLKRLLVETGAKLVISSTWRKLHPGTSFDAILSAACPGLGTFVYYPFADEEKRKDWRTKDLPGQRGGEIQEWLDRHPEVTHFVILDDDSDMLHLKDKLVQTDAYDGLGFRDYRKARAILLEEKLDEDHLEA